MGLNIYFREIVYHNTKSKKNSVCGVFSYEALNVEEARLGNLYLIGKISNFPSRKHKSYDFLLNLLASVMKREFYSDPQKSTLEALESTLQSANLYLEDFSKKGHKEWIGNLDFTCFAFSQNNIHIGQTGNMLIYLFRGDTMSNIARKFSKTQTKKQASKTFSNIATGKLEEDDKVVIANSDILNIASSVKIKNLLSNSSSEEFYNFIKDNLKNKNQAPNSLACLILEAKNKSPVVEKKPTIPIKQTRIMGFNLERKISSPLLKYRIPKYLLILFLFLVLILSPYLVQKLHYGTKIKQIDNLIKRTKQIVNKSELSLVYLNQAKAQVLLQRANDLMANAGSLLTKLPEKVKENSTQKLELIQQNLNTQKNSINNVVKINQIEEIADLSKNSFSFNPKGILKLENNLYLYELTSGFIYKIDLNDNYNPTLIFLSSKDTFKLGTVRENAIILLSGPEKIYVYASNDSYNTYLIKPNLENTLYIKDMTTYNNNLYFLNIEKLNIFKYVAGENSLIGEEWLNEQYKEDLLDAQSIAIDGSVYISKSDGTIVEFVSGRKRKEFKPNISPELTNGNQLFTKPDMKNLYLLDQTNNRIIAINKQDNFTTQYVSTEFNSPTDLWITPDEKTIYVLDGLKVYKINI